VCQSHAFTDWLVHLRGGRVAYGREALAAEYGKLSRVQERVNADLRRLKKLMGEEQ